MDSSGKGTFEAYESETDIKKNEQDRKRNSKIVTSYGWEGQKSKG